MFSIRIIFIYVTIAVAILAVAGILLYFLVYSKKVNSRVQNAQVSKRKMLSPAQVAIICIITALTICGVGGIFVTIKDNQARNQSSMEQYNHSFTVYNASDAPEYMGVFNQESNEGYERKEIVKGDFTYNCFVSHDPMDVNHPQMFMYVSYNGSEKDLIYGFYGKFIDQTLSDSPVINGYGASGSNLGDYILVICNKQDVTTFNFTVSLYDSTDKSETPFNESTIDFSDDPFVLN